MARTRPGGPGLVWTARGLVVTLACLSGGLTALYAGASAPVAAGAAGGGLVVGALAVLVALPAPASEPARSDPRLRWED